MFRILFRFVLVCCFRLENKNQSLLLGDVYKLEEVSLRNRGFWLPEVFWLPEAFHLDFATQDQIEFTLLPLGDEFLLSQVPVHPEAFLLPVACLLPLGKRLRI